MLLTGPFAMLSMPLFDFHLPPCTEGFLIHLSPLWQLPLFPSVAKFPCVYCLDIFRISQKNKHTCKYKDVIKPLVCIKRRTWLFQKLEAPPKEDKHYFQLKIILKKIGNSKNCKINWEFPLFVTKTVKQLGIPIFCTKKQSEILGILMSSLPLQPKKRLSLLLFFFEFLVKNMAKFFFEFPYFLQGCTTNFWNSLGPTCIQT